MSSGQGTPTTNFIFVVPKQALRYVCGPNNINITKLPGLCGAHAFVDPSQVMSHGRFVNIVLSGPAECQVKALGELSYCLMNFDANMRGRSSRSAPYNRSPPRRRAPHPNLSSVPKQGSESEDGEIVAEHSESSAY